MIDIAVTILGLFLLVYACLAAIVALALWELGR